MLVAPVGDFVRLKQFFTTPSQIHAHFEGARFSEIEVHGVYTGPINWVERLRPGGCRSSYADGSPSIRASPTAPCFVDCRTCCSSTSCRRTSREPEPRGRLGRGMFTLSLDFELIWGTVDVRGPEPFRRTCEIEREVVLDRLLELLAEFDISATWCIVGHLFLSSCTPRDGVKHPKSCGHLTWAHGDWFSCDPATSEQTDPIFYGSSLIDKIRTCSVAKRSDVTRFRTSSLMTRGARARRHRPRLQNAFAWRASGVWRCAVLRSAKPCRAPRCSA